MGYGDLSPTQPGTKIFTMVYVLVGIGILLAFINMVAKHAARGGWLGQRIERRGETGDEQGEAGG